MLYEIVVLHRTIGRWLCSLDKVTYINNFGKSKDTPLQHNIANGDKNIGRGTNNNLRIKQVYSRLFDTEYRQKIGFGKVNEFS